MFNQVPWRSGIIARGFHCEKCNCNGHAGSCRYDHEVAEQKLSLDIRDKPRGGGVCIDCQVSFIKISSSLCAKLIFVGKIFTGQHSWNKLREMQRRLLQAQWGSTRCTRTLRSVRLWSWREHWSLQPRRLVDALGNGKMMINYFNLLIFFFFNIMENYVIYIDRWQVLASASLAFPATSATSARRVIVSSPTVRHVRVTHVGSYRLTIARAIACARATSPASTVTLARMDTTLWLATIQTDACPAIALARAISARQQSYREKRWVVSYV